MFHIYAGVLYDLIPGAKGSNHLPKAAIMENQ